MDTEEQKIQIAGYSEEYEEEEEEEADDINEEEEINEVVEDDLNDSTDMTSSFESKNSNNVSSKSNDSKDPNKKLLRMQLSAQTLQKLLKQGKMEKLPTGSFRISADALKELKQGTDVETKECKEKLSIKRKYSSTEESDDENSKQSNQSESKPNSKKLQSENFTASRQCAQVKYQLKEKPAGDSDTETKEEVDSKTKNIKKKRSRNTTLHDYVSDFNTSEEEDEDVVKNIKDSIAELVPPKKGHLSKPVSLFFEELHKTIFGTISDDSDNELESLLEEEEKSKNLALIEPDFSSNEAGDPLNTIEDFWMVGRIGNDGKTKMCIRSTNKTKSWEGRQYPIFNIDTGVGSVTTVTPMMVTSLRTTQQKDASNKALDVTLSDPDLVERLQQKSVSLRKYKEQVKVLRRRYLKLAQKVSAGTQLQTIGDLVAASSKFLTQDQLLFYTMQLKTGADCSQGSRFSVREKLLALGLYQQDPRTYKWLQNMFNLPSTNVLERWLDTIARGSPIRAKQLMYYVYTRYCFRPRDDDLTAVGY